MRRRSLFIGIVLVIGLIITLAYILFPFYKADIYRESLEASFSAALGRTVKLEGPISLTFSLQPTLILEDLHVSNSPGVVQPQLFRADRLEIQISLVPLLQRRLKVEKIILDGADLLLEEGPDGLNNWTIGKDEGPGIWSYATPQISIEIPDTGVLGIKNSHMSYQSYPPGHLHEITIQEGSLIALDEHLRKISLAGNFRDVPFRVEINGGPIVDLFELTKAWPIDGMLSANDVSAFVKGKVGGPNPDQTFDLQVQLNGDRLSALNGLLKTELPEIGPFEIAGDVVLSTERTNLNNLRVKLGSSDLAGQLSLYQEEGRQKLSGALTADVIQVNDFLIPVNASSSVLSPQKSPSPVPAFLLPFDGDLDVTINKWKLGEIELGSSSFTTNLREKHIQVTPFQGKSFGGTLQANLDIDLRNSPPWTRFTANVKSFNLGQALQASGVTERFTGSTDLDVMVLGNGINMQDFLKTLTLKLRTNHMTWGLADSITQKPPPVALHQIFLGVLKGGPIEIAAKGSFQKNAFEAKLMTASPVELIKPENPWPVSLFAQMGDAVFAAKGTLNPELPEMAGTLAVSLKGKQLNQLDTALPPVGPYQFMAQVTKEDTRYRIHDLQARFGTSDLSGNLEVDTAKNTPQFTGILTAEHINFKELSTPGDIPIPTEALGTVNGNLKMLIHQADIGEFELAGLTVEANLHAGFLTVKNMQGVLFDQKSSYGNFQGTLDLDTTKPIPSVFGQMDLRDIRYEHVFSDVQFVNPKDHVINLHAKFSSVGATLDTLLAQSTVTLTGHNLQVRVHGGENSRQPLDLSSNLLVESVTGGPLRLYAEGQLDHTPFRLRFSGGPMSDLLANKGFWPVNIRADVPRAMVELSGYVDLPHPGEKFSLQVRVKGDNLRDLDFLATTGLPDAGPLEIAGLVTKSPVGFHVTNLEGSLAGSDVKGHVTVMTKRNRPRVMGTLVAERIVFREPKPNPADITNQKKGSVLGAITSTVTGVGSKAIDALTGSIGDSKSSQDSDGRVFPDFVFPVDSLRALDLSLESEIKHLIREEQDLGNVKFRLTLEDGLLTLQPVTGNLWSGEIDGGLLLDVKPYVPTLEVNLNIRGLDYGGVTKTLGGTEMIKGQSQSIKLTLKGRGDTLNEVLGRANGQFELVDGPLELSTKYIDLWAADFLTTALSTAWKAEPVTKLNCAVGYFDIDEGEMKTDNILIDTHRVTIGGAGTLNLASEYLDLILTPKPKDPSLVSLAHTVRFTGPLSDPDVSRDNLRIAESGGWALLGLATPLGWAIVIPQIAGTTVGTMNQNPCVEAMKSRHHTALAIEDLKGGLWGKFKRALSNLGGSSEIPPENPQ